MRRRLDPAVLRPSGTILTTQLRLAAEIEARVVDQVGLPATVLDLLVRLDLSEGRGERASRLCNQLNLSAAHMSRTIDRAETMGLVARQADPNDRRAQMITLTPAGDEVLADFAPRLHGLLQTVVHDALDADEIDALVASLERIQQACDSLSTTHQEDTSHA